ncbi:MAG: phenylalanine--tRNA ligase subunit alpha [Patescibacteria group bacterium]
MDTEVSNLKRSFFNALSEVTSTKSLEELRLDFLGRERGSLTKILRSLKDLPVEERAKVGAEANALRTEIEEAVAGKLKEFQSLSSLESDLDLTRPGVKIERGHLHPLTLVQDEVIRIFRLMNFSVVEGPEIETEHYNFDALNVPPNHPARDMWDTFWLKANHNSQDTIDKKKNSKSSIGHRKLLRTHTSPMQIRYMERHEPPFQILVPGIAYRYEATDATHEMNFGQFEGLMVGRDISMANLKYVIETFFNHFFKKKIEFRYRPSYFPFVEPGIEVDVMLPSTNSGQKGRWLEMMGAGMVHPNVFRNARYNPEEWQGFAFGIGLERLAMVKYKIPDIRLFRSGDLRFINQF